MTQVLLPSQLWGLHPVFRAHAKLFIQDIVQLKEVSTGQSGVFGFDCNPITRVDVEGVLVRVEEKLKFFLYSLDDGTEVVDCLCWKKPDQANTVPEVSGLPSTLQKKLSQVQASDRSRRDSSYQLGDWLQVRGKLKTYFGKVEIISSFVACHLDPSRELARMVELLHLYQESYDKPPALQQMLTTRSTQELGIIQELETLIVKQLQENHQPTIATEDFKKIPHVRDILEKHDESQKKDDIISKIFQNMEKMGYIFKNRDSKCIYNVTSECNFLQDQVVNIIKNWNKEKHEDCKTSHILAAVRKLPGMSGLSNNVLKQILEKLESDSDIISTAENSYIVFDNT